jgi:hypothetical protein
LEFSTLVRELGRGRVEKQADDALRSLVEQIRLTGKPGSLTLSLKIKPNGKNAESVTVEPTVTAKAPTAEPEATFMFVAEDCTLSRRDPRQLSLDGLRDVEAQEAR